MPSSLNPMLNLVTLVTAQMHEWAIWETESEPHDQSGYNLLGNWAAVT